MTAPETAPTAPAPSRRIPIVSDAVRLIKVLFSPGEVFEQTGAAPPFWAPWLVVSILFALTQVLQAPYQMRAQELAMAARGATVPENMAMFRYIGLATTPIVVLIIAAIGALVLWVCVSLTGGEARYKQMLGVNIHSWTPICIQQVVMWVVLRMRGLDAVHSADDIRVALGADLLLPAETGGFVRGLAAGINPFAIWATVIVAVGLQVVLRMEPGKAWTAALLSFAISLLVGAALAGMFSGMGG